MKNNINNLRYLQNYSKMHHFYMILLLLFLLSCLNVLSLLLLDIFWAFLWHHLPFWNYLRLASYIILKSYYQKSTQYSTIEGFVYVLSFMMETLFKKKVIAQINKYWFHQSFNSRWFTYFCFVCFFCCYLIWLSFTPAALGSGAKKMTLFITFTLYQWLFS